MDTVGKRLKELRKKSGKSLRELSDLVGVSHSKISYIESDRIKKVNFELINKIANALEIAPKELMPIVNEDELDKLREEIDDLKGRMEEKDDLIKALKTSLNFSKKYILELYANFCESTLVPPFTGKYKGGIPKPNMVAHNLYNNLCDFEIISSNEIDTFIKSKRDKYPKFSEWIESYKKKHTNEQPD